MTMNRKVLLILSLGVLVVVLATILGVCLGTRNASPNRQYSEPGPEEYRRIDCYPEERWGREEVTRSKCESRGCLYAKFNANPDSYIPSCYMDTTKGYRASQENVTKGDRYILRPNVKVGDHFRRVVFEIHYPSVDVVRFKFTDADKTRYEVPLEMVPIDVPNVDIRHFGQTPHYDVKVSENKTFSFKLIRRETGRVLWDTSVGGLYLSNQFLTISTRLPSRNVYGFGENSHEQLRHDLNFRTWGMFARDQPVGNGYHNHYGVHPFYTCLEDDSLSHGVLLLNSNAMDYTLTPLPMLTYRTIGGVLDFFVFLGPTPENVVQQYTSVIGRPYMPPYWSLGFQLSRYGYNSLKNLQAAVNRTLSADIPLDVQYADIDHYDTRKVFTLDKENFAGLPTYFDHLRTNGMHTVIILDPCFIANETDYKPYNEAKAVQGFVEWPDRSGITDPESVANVTDGSLPMLGFVWPVGKVTFPDFFNPDMVRVWQGLIADHFSSIHFDGLWIDMNEPANFGTNENKPWNWPEDYTPYWSLNCSTGSSLDHAPYRTMAVYVYDEPKRKAMLSDKTLCMIGKQGKQKQYSHYDVHSLYGHSQIEPTLRGLRMATGENKRGVVISRSTFPGSGQFSGHWLGDNYSTWKHLRESVVGMMEFNLFGIPYVGADICGFFLETNAELCKRWMQLGAFYPFSRNHNSDDNKVNQDPANFNQEVTRLSRDALRTRYRLLPYLYTLFHLAHIKGNTVVRPLFHEFAYDEVTWDIDKQFMWGPALMIAPILDNGTTLRYYLPRDTWYDYYQGIPVQHSNQSGRWHEMDVFPDSQIPLFFRGGHIIPTQMYANNTYYSRQKPFYLLAYLDQSDTLGGKAKGQLYWDDGEGIDTYERGSYYFAQYTCEKKQLGILIIHNNVTEMSSLILDGVIIMTVDSRPSIVLMNGRPVNFTYEWPKLELRNIKVSMNSEVLIDWSQDVINSPSEQNKLDCTPDEDDMKRCLKRGCIWNSVQPVDGSPRCHMNVSNYGYSFLLQTGKTIHIKRTSNYEMFGNHLINIKVDIVDIRDNVIQIKFYADDRYEVPIELNKSGAPLNPLYEVQYSIRSDESFYVKIIRKSTGSTIWDTSLGGLVFEDQFLQLAVQVPTKNVYGLGENRHFSYKHDFSYRTWPLFSRDQAPGWGDYSNLYGVHPYYLCVEDNSGHSHGVLLLNSNAMEITLMPTPAIVYRTTGGVFDFYVILGDTPEEVTQEYTELIGRPYLPAYWSLGFQLCRYGYENITNMQTAVNRTIQAKIPLDVQYGDIDHFHDNKDFTWDHQRFFKLPEYFDELHMKGMRIIIILDPAILATDREYEPFVRAGDIFVKWPVNTSHPDILKFNSSSMHGYVWPSGPCVFPDYFRQEAKDWWKSEIIEHRKRLNFDGLWIDMNEPANFGTNEEKPWNWPSDSADEPWSLKCPVNQWDDPPYKPSSIYGARLSDKTLCMTGEQSTSEGITYKHYDVHSLYGWSQTRPTLEALHEATGERGVIISRSTYVSSGTMAGHWLGDNDSSWTHMRHSVIGLLEFNLFGIPHIGADICGYFGNVTPTLCQRWMQLGAFYTFSRNHNGRHYNDQDPAAFGTAIAESSRVALNIRYTLLPYLYTLFYEAHVSGLSVIRPLLHEFYKDETTLDIDTQFMWGPALLISPVLEENATTVDVYMPQARWYDYYTGTEVAQVSTHGRYIRLDAPLYYIPLHVRGGYIIPTQQPANNTHYSREKPLGLIVALDENGFATGELFWDDGISIDSVASGHFFKFSYRMANHTLTMSVTRTYSLSLPRLDNIRIFGIKDNPTAVDVITDDTTVNYNKENILYNCQSKELLLLRLRLAQDVLKTGWKIILSL